WDLATGKEAARSPVPSGLVYTQEADAIAVSSDGKRFATARRDGRVDVWGTATGKLLTPLATHRDRIDAVAGSPDGRLAATAGYHDSVRVWELATGKPVCVLTAPRNYNPKAAYWSVHWIKRQPAFTPDGHGLLFVAAGKLALADPATGKTLDLPAGLRDRNE